MVPPDRLHREDWGLIPYEVARERQEAYVEEVFRGERSDVLVFCTHPPVVTLGRATEPGDVGDWAGPVTCTNRGGRATYHGPSQIVIYPILDLRRSRQNLRPRDIAHYLELLANGVARSMGRLGLPAEGLRGNGETGVWVGGRKLASIGIAVRRWVTFHGVAINFNSEPQAFSGINPCGFSSETMSSIEKEMGSELPPLTLFKDLLHDELASLFVVDRDGKTSNARLLNQVENGHHTTMGNRPIGHYDSL